MCEIRAAAYLKKQGMKILCRRYRAADGEIDIIALDGSTTVFVEVKESGALSAGLERVNRDKRRRIRNAAARYMAQNGCLVCRFDVVEESKAGFLHIRNAF